MSARRKLKPEVYARVLDLTQKWQVKKGTETETGDVEDRWFKKPNILWDAQRDRVFSGQSAEHVAEFLCMKKAHLNEGCCLSQSEIAKGAGVYESQVIFAVAEFAKGGFLRISKRGNKNLYRFDLKALAIAKPYEAPRKLELVPDPMPPQEGEDDVRPVARKPQKVIASGRISPLTVSMPIKDRPGTFEEKIMNMVNADIDPMAFALTLINGASYLEVWRPGFARLTSILPLIEGEETAKNPTNGLVGSRNAPGCNAKKVRNRTHSTQVIESVNSGNNASADNTYPVADYVNKSALESALETLRAAEWHEEDFSPAFIAKIAAALVETPLENFTSLAYRDLALPKNRHERGPLKGSTKHPPAILIAYAKQACAAWAKTAAARAAAEAFVKQKQAEHIARAAWEEKHLKACAICHLKPNGFVDPACEEYEAVCRGAAKGHHA